MPHGTIARLLLIDWQSEAIERSSRDIWLGTNPSTLLSRLGLTRGGPVTKKIVEQVERLATCTVAFRFGSAREGVVVNERLVEAFRYVSEEDRRTKRLTRMVSEIRLSQAFYDELRRHPVLVDRAAIRSIQTSPRAIDIYLWLAFRLHAVQDPKLVTWSALWRQFGTEFKSLKSFKSEFGEPLHMALGAYREAKVFPTEKGLLLARSPSPTGAYESGR